MQVEHAHFKHIYDKKLDVPDVVNVKTSNINKCDDIHYMYTKTINKKTNTNFFRIYGVMLLQP